jgi:hypothetical protein
MGWLCFRQPKPAKGEEGVPEAVELRARAEADRCAHRPIALEIAPMLLPTVNGRGGASGASVHLRSTCTEAHRGAWPGPAGASTTTWKLSSDGLGGGGSPCSCEGRGGRAAGGSRNERCADWYRSCCAANAGRPGNLGARSHPLRRLWPRGSCSSRHQRPASCSGLHRPTSWCPRSTVRAPPTSAAAP